MPGPNARLTTAVEHYFTDLRRIRASGGATGDWRHAFARRRARLFRSTLVQMLFYGVFSAPRYSAAS